MKTRQFIAAVAVLSSGVAFAGDTYPYVNFSSYMSTKDRAEVRAEFEQASAQGLLNQNDAEYPIFVEPNLGAHGPAGARGAMHTGRTRDEVRKELETEGLRVNQKDYEFGG
jgi:hypothetical protein